MRQFTQFLLVTIVRGVLFLAPIVLIAVLAREGYGILRRGFEPIARLLPQDRWFGVMVEDLLALTALALVFLIAGLFVATRPGRSLSDSLERAVLYRVPGYLLVRGAVGTVPGLKPGASPEPAMVETGEGLAFALVVERLPSGFCTVFLPDAPTPTTGSVRIIEASRVRPLEASIFGLLGCLTRSGSGAGALAGPLLDDPGIGSEGGPLGGGAGGEAAAGVGGRGTAGPAGP